MLQAVLLIVVTNVYRLVLPEPCISGVASSCCASYNLSQVHELQVFVHKLYN